MFFQLIKIKKPVYWKGSNYIPVLNIKFVASMRVHIEGYSRNASCALNYISTIILPYYQRKFIYFTTSQILIT